MNPIPEIELDGRRKDRRAVALRVIIAVALCLSVSNLPAAQQKNETALTAAQLEESLDRANALTDKYKTLFRDLTAEENGRLTRPRRVGSCANYSNTSSPGASGCAIRNWL